MRRCKGDHNRAAPVTLRRFENRLHLRKVEWLPSGFAQSRQHLDGLGGIVRDQALATRDVEGHPKVLHGEIASARMLSGFEFRITKTLDVSVI